MLKSLFITCLISLASCLQAQCYLTFELKSADGTELTDPVIELTSSKDHLVFEGTENRFGPLPCKTRYKLTARAALHKKLEMDLVFDKDQIMILTLDPETFLLDPVNITATWAAGKSPIAVTQITATELGEKNAGKDLPLLLESTPSLITTTDAGNGIGYTGLRLRGSDQTRINVTINGVPVNEVESHNVFWVDLPDIASSIDLIQVQRGVGTSTYGSGSFGGNISIITARPKNEAYAGLDLSAGSFKTTKQSIRFGTGLLSDKWTIEGRASNIYSDGYIDRAKSSLQSLYLNANYIGKKSILRLIGFSGREETYQSWYGTPESKFNNDTIGMLHYAERNNLTPQQFHNLFDSRPTYNFYQYKNQIDHYGQDYIQLLHSIYLSESLHLSSILHYTKGGGYYEEWRENDAFGNYGLSDLISFPDTFTSANIIRRRWLETDYYGGNISLNKETKTMLWSTGIGVQRYKGLHHGNIIWIDNYPGLEPDYQYYFNRGRQTEFNIFSKIQYQLTIKLNLFADLQYRNIHYKASGFDNDMLPILIDEKYSFFNPKAGLSYDLGKSLLLQASIGAASAQPLREDFIQAVNGKKPVPEKMLDIEIGLKKIQPNYSLGINFYRMQYKNQLILTGELNDVGGSIRTNVPDSYRMGAELEYGIKLTSIMTWKGNISLSKNKIKSFDYYLYDYENGGVIIENFKNTDISYSPSITGYSDLGFTMGDFKLNLISKYVDRQYLDNTQNKSKSLDPYFIQDARLSWSKEMKFCKLLEIGFHAYNVFNTKYANNGYTYSYLYSGLVTENFVYPQAGFNFLVSCKVTW